ncbi:3-oxoacyl-[acyl-carrier-protein] synthase III C-terminal domain-containing protein [Salinispora arenicola]|uniref:3-Oxoacyl-(Acyl-carrier-protein (ACP)) synthase III domain protein n=1 Tax=Salinispora arenicola (strain CNS-205) TaxID=391037 RepID=A8M0K9_SALAI|nr:3-oxoacyl-[acyl-carrier-protein] synthase III C-terminal domain-containing protein [Salinispora arenicola]MCN0176817.1 3-oxoacyl-ACP synthase [Salinispora arenicola]
MSRDPVQFGIRNFGYAFGEDQDVAQVAGDYVDDPERIIRWGYRTFHRAPEGVTATDLAADAARKALAGADLAADDVDLIVLATSEMPEYPHWDSSAALARKLGRTRAQTLLLTEGCASGVTGLGVVAGLMAVQPEINTVLFVAVNRVSEFHRNRMKVNNAVHSDGAVAAVLHRGHPRNRWLATDQFTDPDLCDWFRTDYGGAVAPVPPPGWTSTIAPAGHERVQAHFDKDPRRLGDFVDLLNHRVVEVIEGACRRAGVDRDAVSHIIYINDSPDAIDDVTAPFALPRERSNAALAVVHGHMGAADQLVCLGQHLERGDLAEGDVVAMAGISIGMRWYCTLVRV